MSSYTIAGPHIASEEFAGEAVVLNLATGKYFGLNEPAAAYWDLITSGCVLSDAIDCDRTRQQALTFAAQLLEFGLVAPATESKSLATSFTPIEGQPTIEVYDDLADLILADPIHEVDEDRGWPAKPQ